MSITVGGHDEFTLTPPEPREIRKRVRETSCAGYEMIDGETRMATVKRWLAHFWNRHQQSPTSGELAHFATVRHGDEVKGWSWDKTLLFVRRGLSDAQEKRIAETVPDGVRTCRKQRTAQETWRVIERGT